MPIGVLSSYKIGGIETHICYSVCFVFVIFYTSLCVKHTDHKPFTEFTEDYCILSGK